MAEDAGGRSELFWRLLEEATGSSPAVVALSGVELLLVILALAFIALGSLRLYRGSGRAGARLIVWSLFSAVVGLVIYISFLLLGGNDSGALVDAVFNVYLSLCVTVGAYGFLRLCRSLKRSEG